MSFTLQASQKNLIDEKVQQVSNHSSSVDKYLSQYSYNKNIIELLQDFRITKEINSILENKNISIIILDDFKNILFDSKGYDLNKEAFSNKNLVVIGDENENISIIDNQNEILGLAFIKKDIFNSKFKEIATNNNQNLIIKSNSDFEKNKIELISIKRATNYDKNIYIIAYEDNRDIQKIINDNRTSILIGAIPIMIILLLFSIFLSSVVISPIKQLADSAKNIQTKTKSTLKMINLNKRKDEIGDL